MSKARNVETWFHRTRYRGARRINEALQLVDGMRVLLIKLDDDRDDPSTLLDRSPVPKSPRAVKRSSKSSSSCQMVARLAHGFLTCRSRGKLPKAEEEIEDYLRLALIFPVEHGLPHRFTPTRQSAPAGYLPMLPVPLWPDYVIRREEGAANADDLPSEETDAKSAKPSHSANRKKDSDERKRDPFILNRFEILAMAEMVNVDRPADDRASIFIQSGISIARNTKPIIAALSSEHERRYRRRKFLNRIRRSFAN